MLSRVLNSSELVKRVKLYRDPCSYSSFCYVERQRTRAKIYARNSDTLDGVWRKFACFDDTSLDPHSSVRINNSDIIAAIKQQLPLFFPSHPPQLHVCTERKEFLLWFIRWTWFWPKVLLLEAPSPHSLISERLKVTRHFFNATFGSFWTARAIQTAKCLVRSASECVLPAASFVKWQQTGRKGEFRRSLFQARSRGKLYKLFDLKV